MDFSSASSEILFHGMPSKSKHASIRKHNIVVIITVNSISFYETTICRKIFSKYFSPVLFELLENCSSASKYVPQSFRKFTIKHPWQSLMSVKLQALRGATIGYVL